MHTQYRSRTLQAFARFARFLAAGAFLFAVGTAPAFANAGMGVQVIFPPSVTVGQTNLSATIDIQNTSTPDTLTIALNTITLIPACGAYSFITCTQLDPGVLSINTPATGRALTACAGVSFTVAPTGQPDGSYSFTPLVPITLGTPGSATDRCIIDFTFNVLKAPTKDANGTTGGLQTLPSATVSGTANDTSQAVGFGTAFFVNVEKGTPAIVTSASPAVVAGGNIFDTATLSGGTNPTGTITFRLYGPNDLTCAAPAIFTNVQNVNGNGNYQSGPFGANLVGSYRWIASYSGDANNAAVAGACNDANESVTVTPGTPSLTTNASAAIKLGGTVSDTATLLSGISPTGTITFRLYGPSAAVSCTAGNLVFTSSPVNVNGNGNYTSTPLYTPTAIGTYRWIASYSGDANNNPITGACGDANETVVVSQATPTLATQASGNVVIGNAVGDTATIAAGVAPTGTIVFQLFGPSSTVVCTANNLVFTSAPVAVAGNGSYPSPTFVPTVPGTYRWIATYSGDTNNAGIAGACGATNETVMISKASPGLATTASAGGVVGVSVNDSATLTGGYAPLTGTLIFRLYGPAAGNTCTDGAGGNLVFTSSAVTVNGAGVYPSPSFTPTVAGTYRWRATYSGDVNNNSSVGACGATGETVIITKASPTIATIASPGGAIGTQLTDTATVSGGSSPTGTVTFSLYGPNNATCSGNPIFTSTNTLSGGVATSNAYTTTAAGAYRWTVLYNGDANNNTAAGVCNAPNEMATITQTTPTIATLASVGGTVGTSISDTATVTGSSPTGTVTFNLYGPDNLNCTGSPIFTAANIPLVAGSANSGTYTPTAPGVYRWTASYSGDANNIAVSHPCNSANESSTISKRSPTIATQASAGGAIGTALTDTATLTGALNPTGTMTFNLYGPDNLTCTGAAIFTSVNNVVGTSATSNPFTTVAAGVYRWTAAYSGDANNNAVSHPCNSANESATITKSTPTIVTQASAGGNIGTQLTDTATVSGGTNPTGTVTFNLYGPDNVSCTGSPIFTSSNVALVGGSATSTAFTTVAAGVYRWTANYSGDANNNAVSHPCNSTNESATINKTTPTIVTQASAGGAIGTQLTDTATVTGTNPTGTVTFNLYGPDNVSCTGSPVFTSSNVALVGGSATSTAFTTVAAGVYRWTANYSGDANNNAVSHPCNSANESATITKTTPTIVTQASAGGAIGTQLTDTATVTGSTPTGTVTFNLYGPDNVSCTGSPVFTSSNVALVGGSATSTAFTTLAAGVYRWTASYSGDANNNAVSHPCNSANESATIGKSTPTIVTQASPGGFIGQVLTDTATVSGGNNPTGTVTFNLYGPDNATCSGSPVFTSANVPLVGGSATSTSFTPTLQGVYRWTASYSGDANNIALNHPCNSPNEAASIAKQKEVPTIGTVASAGGPLGTALTDTATVTSTVLATGTVTFALYGPDDASCSGTAIFTSANIPLVAGSATSGPFTPTLVGVYRWRALYNGDDNNDPVIASCNAPNENATITKVTPTLVTQTAPLAILGDSVTDTATLSGGTNPTGSITFRLYGPNDGSCTNTPAFTSSAVTVNGNGSYPSPGFTPTLAGTYRWIASYTGDANNAALTGACNDANENVSVTSRAPPPPVTPIPTLSEWALVLLAMMMGAVAMAGMRKRRR